MFFYICIFSLLVLFLTPVLSRENFRMRLSLVFIILFIFSSIRYNIGRDYPSYEVDYRQMASIENFFDFTFHKTTVSDSLNEGEVHEVDFEKGWVFLNKLFPSFQLLVIFLSLLFLRASYILIVSYIDRHYYWFAIFLMLFNFSYFMMSLSGIRQFGAVSIGIFAFNFANRKELLPFLLCLILAWSIHRSGAVIAFIYLCMFIPDYLKTKPLLMLLSIFSFLIFFPVIILYVLPLIVGIIPALSTTVAVFTQYKMEGMGFKIFYFVYIFSNIFILIKVLSHENSQKSNMLLLGILYLMIAFLSLYFNVFQRIAYFFLPFFIISCTYCYSKSCTWLKFVMFSINGIYIIKEFVSMFDLWWVADGWTPYQTIIPA